MADAVARRKNVRLKVALAGILTGNKGVELIKSLANDVRFKECDFHVFGYKANNFDAMSLFASMNNVSVETNLTDFEYQQRLQQLDILICYRDQYRGETSLTTLEAMRYGVATIVKEIGWFNELPNGSVIRLSSKDEIAKQLESLVRDKAKMRKVSETATATIKKDFLPEKYASNLHKFITDSSHRKTSINHRLEALFKRAKSYDAIETEIEALLHLQVDV